VTGKLADVKPQIIQRLIAAIAEGLETRPERKPEE
jgi:hypothetical protein